MLRRGVAASVSAVAVVGLAGGHSVLTTPRQPHSGPDDSQHAVQLLHRAVLAHARIAYRGTRLVSVVERHGTATAVLDVRHVPGQGTALRVRGGSGTARGVTFVAQRQAAHGDDAALEGGPLQLLVENYTLAVTGHERVSGRPVTIVTARSSGVATGRFWIDEPTGLLVRRDVYDGDGALVRVSAFVGLQIEQPGLVARPPARMPQPEPLAMSVSALSGLRRHGWECPLELPGGFRVTDVRRLPTERPAVQTSYSDGLSTVSVFEQRGSLDADAIAGFEEISVDGAPAFVRYGMPTYLTWESDGSVYTALTDAPGTYLPHLVRAYPVARPADTGLWDRLWRGSGRLLTWVTPLSVRL